MWNDGQMKTLSDSLRNKQAIACKRRAIAVADSWRAVVAGSHDLQFRTRIGAGNVARLSNPESFRGSKVEIGRSQTPSLDFGKSSYLSADRRFMGGGKAQLEALLPDWLRQQRWFGGKARTIQRVTIKEIIPVACDEETAFIALARVDYKQGDADLYTLPLAFTRGKQAAALNRNSRRSVICDLTARATGQTGVLYDAVASKEFCRALLRFVSSQRRLKAARSELRVSHTAVFRRILGKTALPDPAVGRAEQSNSSVIYGGKFILKLFRRLDAGTNPELEIGRFLTARKFPHSQQLAGAIEFMGTKEGPFTLAVLNGFIPKARDAWEYTLEALGRYYDRAASFVAAGRAAPMGEMALADMVRQDLPANVAGIVGGYLDSARLLGERTAAMHLALASKTGDKAFAPEPFMPRYVHGLFQSMRNLAARNLRLLRKQLKTLPPDVAPLARRVLEFEQEIQSRYRALCNRRITARRIRCHGDFHLGQVLHTGGDFVIIDFEGEPLVPLCERRIKQSSLRDVAGMVRSFHYAAWAGLHQRIERGTLKHQNVPKFEPWARLWYQAVSSAYLRAYLRTMGRSEVLPRSEEELLALLPAYLLNKAIYEIGYELNNRPTWLPIPLQGILQLLETAK